MLKNIPTDTAVKTHLSPEFIVALTQVCQDQMAHPRASFTTSLNEIAYIAFIASEQSQYRHTECCQFYHDLAAADFQISPNALSPFLDRLITCLNSLIKNIRILNHHTLLSPYYHNSVLKAIQTLLDNVDSDAIADLANQFSQSPKVAMLSRRLQKVQDLH